MDIGSVSSMSWKYARFFVIMYVFRILGVQGIEIN